MGTQTFIPRDYDVFAGLDVDKKSISVTFTDHQGFLKSLNMPYKVEHLVNYVRKHYPDKKVAFAYEAGPTGYALYDGLEAQAYPCLIASPSMIPKAPGQRVKTNRLDSRGISENLRGGQLKGIHVPTPLYRELRHLTQLRDTLVSEMVRMKQRIKSLLLMEGLEFPPAPAGSGRSWSKRNCGNFPVRAPCALSSIGCSTVWSLMRSKSLRRPERSAAFARPTRNCLSVSSI